MVRRTTPCQLSATAYSVYSQLLSISGDRSSIRNVRMRHVVVTGTRLSQMRINIKDTTPTWFGKDTPSSEYRVPEYKNIIYVCLSVYTRISFMSVSPCTQEYHFCLSPRVYKNIIYITFVYARISFMSVFPCIEEYNLYMSLFVYNSIIYICLSVYTRISFISVSRYVQECHLYLTLCTQEYHLTERTGICCETKFH